MSTFQYATASVDLLDQQEVTAVNTHLRLGSLERIALTAKAVVKVDGERIHIETRLEMNRAQALQMMSALYLILTDTTRDEDGDLFLYPELSDLEKANPIELLKGYQYDEAQALAQYDAWRDEQVEA